MQYNTVARAEMQKLLKYGRCACVSVISATAVALHSSCENGQHVQQHKASDALPAMRRGCIVCTLGCARKHKQDMAQTSATTVASLQIDYDRSKHHELCKLQGCQGTP